MGKEKENKSIVTTVPSKSPQEIMREHNAKINALLKEIYPEINKPQPSEKLVDRLNRK